MDYQNTFHIQSYLQIGTGSIQMIYFRYLLILLIFTAVHGFRSPMQDLITYVPGYGPEFAGNIFAGFLKATNLTSAHYIFVQSIKGSLNNDPLTLWINGQPGCSSKIGFLKQIGPYLIPEGTPYRLGDRLIQNPYSWHRLSNLLFIDGPVGVGYNSNQNASYQYNDENTAQFYMNTILDFFKKFPEYASNQFYLAGEYYAGKMIPDLALKINNYNSQSSTKINIKAILIGNGIMDLSNDNLQKSQISYIYSHNFVDPTLDKYWQIACQADPTSAGCTFFLRRYDEMLSGVNYHNIYGTCYQTQNSPSASTKSQIENKNSMVYNNKYRKCQYYQALQEYFSLTWVNYHAMPPSVQFSACNQTIFNKYDTDQLGSISQYRQIFKETSIRVQFYSGDWDDVVPYTYTIRNLDGLGFKQNGTIMHWVNAKNQHIGFKRNFQKDGKLVKLWIVKGAGHEVPQQKPEVAYQLFKDFLSS